MVVMDICAEKGSVQRKPPVWDVSRHVHDSPHSADRMGHAKNSVSPKTLLQTGVPTIFCSLPQSFGIYVPVSRDYLDLPTLP